MAMVGLEPCWCLCEIRTFGCVMELGLKDYKTSMNIG